MWSVLSAAVMVVLWVIYAWRVHVSLREIGVTAVVTKVDRDDDGKILNTTYEYLVGKRKFEYSNGFQHEPGDTVALRVDPKTKRVTPGDTSAQTEVFIFLFVLLAMLSVGIGFWVVNDLTII